jgi:hypothetical protein
VRQIFEAHFKANVGNLFAFVADFVVRRFEPSLYQPFLRRQAAYLFEIALETIYVFCIPISYFSVIF